MIEYGGWHMGRRQYYNYEEYKNRTCRSTKHSVASFTSLKLIHLDLSLLYHYQRV